MTGSTFRNELVHTDTAGLLVGQVVLPAMPAILQFRQTCDTHSIILRHDHSALITAPNLSGKSAERAYFEISNELFAKNTSAGGSLDGRNSGLGKSISRAVVAKVLIVCG